MKDIIINPQILKECFPYFENTSDTVILNASKGVGSYISTKLGTINIPADMQIRGNYLACCHLMYLQLNPSVGNGMISNAGQGVENLGYQQRPVKNWFDYQLGLTSYGLELLAILQQIQPPIPSKPINTVPYYNTINNKL